MATPGLIQKAYQDLVTHLTDNIPDPRPVSGTGARVGKWIMPEYPRVDAQFPRISIRLIRGVTQELAIGEKVEGTSRGRYIPLWFEVGIWVKLGESLTIGTLGSFGGSLMLAYLNDQVIDQLEAKRSLLNTSFGWHDVKLLNVVPIPLDEEHMLLQRNLIFQIELEYTF